MLGGQGGVNFLEENVSQLVVSSGGVVELIVKIELLIFGIHGEAG